MIFVIFSLSHAVFTGIELDNEGSKIEISSGDRYGLSVMYRFDRLHSFTVTTEEGNFSEIFIEDLAHTNIIGEPKLPMSRRLIAVPLEADVSLKPVDYKVTDYHLFDHGLEYPIIPRQHPVAKCPDAEIPPFAYNRQVYQRNGFGDSPLVKGEEIGIMRGVRLFAVEVYPVQYNPQEGILRIFNNIEIEITFSNGNYVSTEELRQRTYSPYFDFLYKEQIINYEPAAERDNLTRYPVKYIIISDPMFSDALQPFIEWKTRKGFETIVGYTGTAEVGSTTTTIRNYILNIWNAATPEDPAPSFLLFVGDTAQIPPFSGDTGSHVTDLTYVRLEGSDYLPEMFYGRFSANNLAELQPQIDKTLEYEQYLMADPSYLGEAVLIAGHDSYWASSHGNGHINYGTQHYFNASNGIVAHPYLYPQSSGSSQAIINNVSNGVGYVNYTAHGSPTSWSDPSFTIGNINSLQNSGKYPFVVGNCCITNKFDVYTCFGEAWLRASNKGSIGYIGGTDNTYWDEDYWWGVGHVASIPSHGNALPYDQTGPGMFDGLFHTQGEDFINWYTTGGAMIYSGNMAVEHSNSTRKNYYWEIYSLMGDPSLTPYMRVPLENTANYPTQIFLGQSQIDVTAEPYSYVGLSMDGEIHGTTLIDETGQGVVHITPFSSVGTADLVITLQNHEPVISEIQVIPNEGSYVVLNSYELDVVDSTINLPQFGDLIDLHVTLENVGIEEATNVTAQLSTEDTYITIVDGSHFAGNIEAEGTVLIENAFRIQIADNIPDQHRVYFTLTISDDEEAWLSYFNFAVNAPEMVVLYPDIVDSLPDGNDDGLLDPGETVTLLFPIHNDGQALSPETMVRFVGSSPYITLISDEFVIIGELESGEMINAPFEIAIDPAIPNGSNLTIGLNVFSGNYTIQETFTLPVGLIIEDFSAGSFDSFDWTFSGNNNWFVDSSQAHSGNYSARSGSISHNQSSSLSLSMDVPVEGEISFYFKVSSENNYDFLRFFINDQQQEEWSGEVDWTQVSFPVQAGNNSFCWTYIKDWSVSNGSDCAWVDYIIFPASGVTSSGSIFALYPQDLDFGEVPIGFSTTRDFTISNFGDETLYGIITTYQGFVIENETRRTSNSPQISRNSRDTGQLRDEERYDYTYMILPESNQNFILKFTPDEIDDYSGQITITSDDVNNPLAYIAVNAAGVFGLLPPTDLEYSIQNEFEVYLTWQEPSYPDNGSRLFEDSRSELLGYNVYRNEVIINDEALIGPEYVDLLPGNGTYEYYVTALYDGGESEPSNSVVLELLSTEEEETVVPYVTTLRQNYPNPFNPNTTIEFSLQKRERVKIEIFNIAGQLVRILLNDVFDPGDHRVKWNSINKNNKPQPSGIYFYRMTTESHVETRKMILLK
jgi:hypothetical protein